MVKHSVGFPAGFLSRLIFHADLMILSHPVADARAVPSTRPTPPPLGLTALAPALIFRCMTRHRRRPAPDVCPVCGEDVPRGASACPECGADERSGWNTEDTLYDGMDLPDDEGLDYDAFMEREFGVRKPGTPGAWIKRIAVLLLVALLVWFFLR